MPRALRKSGGGKLIAIRRMLEPAEKEAAKERRGGDHKGNPGKFPELARARDKVAAKLATLSKGANQHASNEAPSQTEAAKLATLGQGRPELNASNEAITQTEARLQGKPGNGPQLPANLH